MGAERARDARVGGCRQLGSGAEVGLSLTVDLDGDRVVDVWGGHRDATRTQPWRQDTVTNVWSLTKTVTGLAALMLVDAGELDVHAPVARYWPEFAANGKQDVEVRHLLSHTSGVSGLDHPAQLEDLYDVRAAAARMAAQAPWWEPGSASGYHVLSYGPGWRAAELGAANGHGNARSLAQILAPVARGQLLEPDTAELIFDEQSNGADLVNGRHLRWGIGYALPDRRTLPWIPDGRIAFWGGWGGSMAIMDLDRRLTISYVMNNMGADILGSPRAATYTRAVYDALGVGSQS